MSPWARQILFGDVDAMYASAAVVANPSLAGKVVAVGGPAPRGIITAASYPARVFGVRSAMPTAQAFRLCPDLILVPPDRPLYQRLHNQMREVTHRFFPVTAWSSIDEFYADTSTIQSMHPDPRRLGEAVKDAILVATGLRCTIAIASGKTVAKVAADSHKPNGLVVIEPGTEEMFLAPRPVQAMPGIGPKTAGALQRRGVCMIGDLLDPRFEEILRSLWGPRRYAMQALARGIDTEAVTSQRNQKSLGHETTFDEDTDSLPFLEETLHAFLSQLAHDLRVDALEAGGFTLKLKDSRFRITTRHRQFPKPLNYDPRMWPYIREALYSLVGPGKRYRLAGLSLSDLAPAAGTLFDQRTARAVAAMDALIEKHGAGIIGLGGVADR